MNIYLHDTGGNEDHNIYSCTPMVGGWCMVGNTTLSNYCGGLAGTRYIIKSFMRLTGWEHLQRPG